MQHTFAPITQRLARREHGSVVRGTKNLEMRVELALTSPLAEIPLLTPRQDLLDEITRLNAAVEQALACGREEARILRARLEEITGQLELARTTIASLRARVRRKRQPTLYAFKRWRLQEQAAAARRFLERKHGGRRPPPKVIWR